MPPETMPTIDDLDQMDDLTAAAFYPTEVHRIAWLTSEEREGYVAQARNGSIEARNRLIIDCLPYTLYKAGVTYAERQPAHTDVLDLVGHANLKMLEAMPRALRADKPLKYLLSIAAMEMRLYCMYDDPMVKRPRNRALERSHPHTVSIEAVAEPAMAEDTPLPDGSYQLVYDAVHELTEQRQEIVTAMYGLFGESTVSIEDMASMLNIRKETVSNYLWRAKVKLTEKLEPYIL